MMNVILRRSSSFLVAKRSLNLCLSLSAAALGPTESILQHHLSAKSGGVWGNNGWQKMGYLGRNFHVKSGALDFKASPAWEAESAVDHYVVYEERDKEEGLEISKLGISEDIVSALSRRGIVKLFPIQRAVMEPAMQGRDMIGRARTGTGKTLAFGIPILDKIIQFNAKHGRGRNPLCLVLAPTRELAKQVEKEFHESAPSLDTICVYGGSPISRQMQALDYGVDIAVGTPGRIIDLIKRGALNLSEVQFLVLDEADQMLSMGFVEDVETILDKLPLKRQSMMFSATMPPWIRNLTHKYLKNPLTIDLVGESDQKLADGISLYCIASDMYAKASIIGPLITEHAKGGKCIVFTQTKRDADRLAYAMARNYKCEALHGDISQSQRERTLSGFREGHFNILVATDVAARGLDVPNVDLVIHYELPNTSETFVHRTGRTGRAGKKGSAILIYTREQARAVKGIERDVGCRFTELPKIAVEGGSGDVLSDMGGRPATYGGMRDRRYGDMTFGRSGGYRSPGSGRFSQGGEYGGPSSGRFGSYANRSGNFSGPGSSRSGGSGDFGRSDRSGGFGEFGRSNLSDGLREFSRSDRSGAFNNSSSGHSSRFGDLADNQSSRSGGSFGNAYSDLFGGTGDNLTKDNQNSGRRSF